MKECHHRDEDFAPSGGRSSGRFNPDRRSTIQWRGYIYSKNCVSCHNSPKGAARLDLKDLSWEPANPDNFAVWVKVHDRVSAGEMPPAGIPRPASDSITQFVKSLDSALTNYERSITTERGRAGLRRLNAYEYENVIRDLLSVSWVQLKGKLP